MDDLISRVAAIAKVEKARKASRTLTGMDFVLMLKDQPTVDAAPVVHGRWVGWRHHWAWLVCDQCNEKMLVRKSNHGYIQQFPHNFCPNCGAKMDGGDHE